MRVLVTGGRDFADKDAVWRVLDAMQGAIGLVIHGGARGADAHAAEWAVYVGVSVDSYPANWREHGKGAGARRNAEMLAKGEPHIVLAFPGGRGTEDMVQRALKAGVPVIRVEPKLRGANAYAPSPSRAREP